MPCNGGDDENLVELQSILCLPERKTCLPFPIKIKIKIKINCSRLNLFAD